MKLAQLRVPSTAGQGRAVRAIGGTAQRRGSAGVLPLRVTGSLWGPSARANVAHIAPEVPTPTASVPLAVTVSALMPGSTRPSSDVRMQKATEGSRFISEVQPTERGTKERDPLQGLEFLPFSDQELQPLIVAMAASQVRWAGGRSMRLRSSSVILLDRP